MKISNNYNNLSFKARNPKIRQADRVLRHVTSQYPMLSSSYAEIYYHTSKQTIKDSVLTLRNKILDVRNSYVEYFDNLFSSFELFNTNLSEKDCTDKIKSILPFVKQRKVGNCEEHTVPTYAALCANGYTNSEQVSLYYQTDLVDKNTNEILASAKSSLDHTFVLTSMTDNPQDKKNIVVDYWLGYADSISGAINRFKDIYSKEDLQNAENKNLKKLKKKHKKEYAKGIARSHFVFMPDKQKPQLNQKNAEATKDLVKTEFQELII